MPMRIPEAPRQFEYVNPDNGGARLQPMRVTTSEAMFGATGAQALAQAGKDLRAFGARLQEDVERRDRAVAEEAFAQRQKEETAFRLEQNKRRGRNALGAADGSSLSVADASRQWASEARRRFTENMSPYQKRLFSSLADRADTQLYAWAGSKEQREDQVWRTSLWQGTAEEASNRAAAMYALGDMDAFRSSMAEVQHAVRQMGAMQGWDEKYTDQKALDTMGDALLPIGQTLIADGNLRGAQAFIKEHAPALGAKRVLSLQNAVKAEQRRQAAEARAAATLHRMEMRQIAALAPDQIAYGRERGDFSAAEKTVSLLERGGMTQEAAVIQDHITLNKEAYTILSGMRGQPFVEQLAAVEKNLDSLVTPNNARASLAVKESVKDQIRANIKMFQNDPAGSVKDFLPQDETLSPEQRMQASLELQAAMGQGITFVPQVLSKDQQKRLKNTYDSLTDGVQRLKFLTELQQTSGAQFVKAAREANIPDAVVQLAPVLPELSDRTGGTLLAVAGKPWKELPGGEDTLLKNDAQATAMTSKIVEMQTRLAQAIPFNENLARQTASTQDALAKAALVGVPPSDIDTLYDVVQDSNMYLQVPKNKQVNIDQFTDALHVMNSEVLRRFQAGMPSAGGGYLERLWNANARRIADYGLWVSDDNGAVLVDPHTGKQAIWPDTLDPVRVDYSDAPELIKRMHPLEMSMEIMERGD